MARQDEPILLAGPRDTLWPLFEHQVIALNGKKPDDCGSFVLFKELAGWALADQGNTMATGTFETAGRPHETIVVSVLDAARAIAPGAIEIHYKGGNLTDDGKVSGDTTHQTLGF